MGACVSAGAQTGISGGAVSLTRNALANNQIDINYAKAKIQEHKETGNTARLNEWEKALKSYTSERKQLQSELEQTKKKTITVRGRQVEYKNAIPKGWSVLTRATTAPKGYTWISNGESQFSGKRKTALVLSRVANGQIRLY